MTRVFIVAILFGMPLAGAASATNQQPLHADVLVYGATPGGIAASLSAAKAGHSVALVEPTDRVGGLLTSGLSYTDFRSFEALTGFFFDFSQRVQADYERRYGKNSEQAKAAFRGTHGEPSVNLRVLEAMLAEHPTITIVKQLRLRNVTTTEYVGGRRSITSVVLESSSNDSVTVSAKVFIDGTYEGDLMAAAGESYHVGRESRDQYGEPMAGNSQGQADGDARAVLHTDSVAIGDYVHNCHGTGRSGTRFNGNHDGEFYKPVSPYQIPYGVIVASKTENLLVPVACSASHFGFGALRLEPIWSSLGQAAGWAAAQSMQTAKPVQDIDGRKLQRLLHADRSATIYVSDVPPTAPEFAAVQWWGTRGGLHGLASADPPKPQSLGGQYNTAFPGHFVEPTRMLTDELRTRWNGLLPSGAQRPIEQERVKWIIAAFAAAEH